MKNIYIILSLILCLSACNNSQEKEDPKVRYTQNSDEINTMKAAINDYEKGDWKAWRSHYADTASFNHNSRENAMDLSEIAAAHQQEISALSSYQFPDEFDEYEMVVTDDGETWVNYWGTWQGTIASNGKKVEIPVHLTSRFINGKIVEEHGYYDNSIMMLNLEKSDSSMVAQDSIK